MRITSSFVLCIFWVKSPIFHFPRTKSVIHFHENTSFLFSYTHLPRDWPFSYSSLSLSLSTSVTSSRRNLINMVCCVGPDNVYQQGTYVHALWWNCLNGLELLSVWNELLSVTSSLCRSIAQYPWDWISLFYKYCCLILRSTYLTLSFFFFPFGSILSLCTPFNPNIIAPENFITYSYCSRYLIIILSQPSRQRLCSGYNAPTRSTPRRQSSHCHLRYFPSTSSWITSIMTLPHVFLLSYFASTDWPAQCPVAALLWVSM
jgi:hypothetical protein